MSDQIERFLTLRQIAASFGPALMVSPVVYWFVTAVEKGPKFTVVNVLAGLLIFLCGVFLCAQTYYRATQVALTLVDAFPDEVKKMEKEREASVAEKLDVSG